MGGHRTPGVHRPDAQNRRTDLSRAKTWIANTAPATMADHIRQAHAFFRHRTPDQMLATAAPWSSSSLPGDDGQDFWPAA
jgi:hypothetical protein